MYLETSKRHCSLILTFRLATYVVYYRILSQKESLQFSLNQLTLFLMPKLEKVIQIEITPTQYVNSCTYTELLELSLELDRKMAIVAHEEKKNKPKLIF